METTFSNGWAPSLAQPPQCMKGCLTVCPWSSPAVTPYTAPTVKFITTCFHPNVDLHGNICLDILKEKWSASYDVRAILLSIQSLLGEPNNDSPLNGHAAELWANQTAYKKHLLEHYKKANQS
ncbi:hypothetical protein O3P69_005925 [Scylla paramamosain]|uniref:UBC core domain-containing protein n=1 Tax=Scylla paramamosain TaxID=85552 RepID=A0AAW0U3Y8_SCYPA